MFKKLLLLTILLLTLDARENPFMPAKSEDFISTNQFVTQTPLKRATIKLPSDARILESVSVKYKKLDGSIATQTIELQNSIDWHLPLFISQSYLQGHKNQKVKTLYKKKKVAQIRYATFYSSGKELSIVTKDKMIRSFTLANPHRVVVDFARTSHLKHYEKSVEGSIFKKIRVGNHKDYYRVVVKLDGYYRSKTIKVANGYKIELR